MQVEKSLIKYMVVKTQRIGVEEPGMQAISRHLEGFPILRLSVCVSCVRGS